MSLVLVRNSGLKGSKATPSASVPTLINGNGAYSGAPVKVEDPDYPMSNLMNPDRYAIYRNPGVASEGGGDMDIQIDLGGNNSVLGAGILGWRVSNVFPNQAYFRYRTVITPPYANDNWAADTPIFSLFTRDPGQLFDAPRSARYWSLRIPFAAFGAFTIGRIYFIVNKLEFDYFYSSGTRRRVYPKVVTEAYGGQPTISNLGDPHTEFEYRWDNTDEATYTALRGIIDDRTSVLMVAPDDGGFYEVVLNGPDLEARHVWSAPNRYAVTLPLRSLP